ncbi:MAG: aspartyl/asparaginyl beta-hydroxylase domain-containing protein [Sphingobium sp.]|nr:aspartyl/asparaginyl beta-hydroxylase domain-containing protein [Sphingobium sp.]
MASQSQVHQQADRMLAAAAAAKQRGDRAEEQRLIDAALAAAPGHPAALNSRGMLALGAGDFATAAACFAAAAQADPGEAALWMNLASAHRGAGDAAGERSALAAALAIDQRHFMAQLRMAELLQRLGENPAAADHWRRALALSIHIDPMPAPLAATLAEARAFVDAQMADFTGFIDSGLAPAIAAADTTDARRFRACIDHEFGRRQIYRNECSGLYYPFLPADEFFDRRHFPWMAELERKAPAIRAEFEALVRQPGVPIRPYVAQEPGTPENKWTALDGSLDWGACFLWEYGVRNEPVCALCPETVAALDALPRADIPGRAPSAFFSLLRPRSHIPAHTGVTNTRAIIHLPLIVPPGCRFRVGGETRAWEEGQAFAFDDTIDHEAWNDSDSLRVVLIFDVWNPHLSLAEQQLLKQFFRLADESGHNPASTRT